MRRLLQKGCRQADRAVQGDSQRENCAMGTKVSEQDEVAVNGKPLKKQERKVVLALYKPVGVTCTERDRHAQKTLNDMVKYPVRVTYAGRLDKDSEGLLLLTNDGDLIDAMMRGANRHEKEYVVKVTREVTEEFLEKLAAGVYIKELAQTTRPCQVEMLGKYTFRIILTQGLNRQIRRMCAAFGVEVKSLKRVRVMNIMLGNLKPGAFKEITGEELERLYRDCALIKE